MFAPHDKPLEEKEYPDEDDLGEEDDSPDLDRCPACGELVYEGVAQCPYCRAWVVGGGSWRQSRRWYVRGGLYLVKTLLVNWFVWVALGALGALAVIVEVLR